MKKYYRFFVIFLVLSCWIPQVATAQVVSVPDSNLARALRQVNNLAPDEPILRGHIRAVKELEAEDVNDLTGLEHATFLESLHLLNNQISDLRPLENLTNLISIDLTGNPRISDLRPLENLTKLKSLDLTGSSQISDFSPLNKLPTLTSLGLFDAQIDNTDLIAIASLRNLTSLGLGFNNISDVSPLARMTNLTWLSLIYNEISDVSPLVQLTNLTWLAVRENPIQDLSPLTRLPNLRNLDVDITAPVPDSRTTDPTPEPSDLIPDPNLAAVIREMMGLAPNASIRKERLPNLRTLIADGRQIKDLTGLEHATGLTTLILFNNQIQNVVPLAKMTELRVLYLQNNQIRDVSPIAKMTRLEALHIHNNQIRSVSPLAGLKWLHFLNLQNNQIRDVSPLARLTSIERLRLAGNPITDTSPLAKLTKLVEIDVKITDPTTRPRRTVQKPDPPRGTDLIPDPKLAAAVRQTLDLGKNAPITEQDLRRLTSLIANGRQITNLTGLEHATKLELLFIRDNKISDLAPLAGLTQLVELNLGNNQIRDVSPLARLTQLQRLLLYRNQIRDVSPLARLTQLQRLDLAGNQIRDVSHLAGLTRLKTLSIFRNEIRDVSPLAGLVNLKGLYLRENPIQNTAPLASLKKLIKVDIEISREPIVQIGPSQRPPMYWIDANTGTLHRLIGNEVENFIPQVQNATSLTVDAAYNKIYWTEQLGRNKGSIKRANLDGSNVQVLATPNGVPRSIAVDSMRGKLYWTDSRGRIQRSNLNGRQIRNLIRNLDAPENITVDVAGGMLYWTEASGRIRSANLNGKSIQDIASGLGTLSSITILGNKIYYGTTLPGESRGSIGRANLNGSNLRRIASLQSTLSGIAIDPVGNKLYWTESDGYMRRGNLNGRNIQEVVSGLASPAYFVLGSPSASTAAPADSSLTSSDTLIPDATGLLSNYPNPFNPETWIPYQLAKPADVTLTIYAVNGEMVRRLELGHQAAGIYQSKRRAAYWDGRNALGELVASGVYFYTLTAGEFSTTRKMLIRK